MRRKKHWILRIVRLLAGLKQEDLARKLYLNRSTVSRIESGAVKCDEEVFSIWFDYCLSKVKDHAMGSWLQSLLSSDFDQVRFA